MTRGRGETRNFIASAVFAVIVTGWADRAEAEPPPVDETVAQDSPKDPMGVTDEGVPDEAVEADEGVAEVKLFVSKRFFYVPVTSGFLNDQFANTKFRATPATGAGVHLFDTKKVEWDLGGGVGYQYIRFQSTAAGVENPQNDGFISFMTHADFDFTDDVELVVTWTSSVVYANINLTNHLGSAKFSVEVTDILDLETTFKFYRTENPPPRADGTVPQKNDYEFISQPSPRNRLTNKGAVPFLESC